MRGGHGGFNVRDSSSRGCQSLCRPFSPVVVPKNMYPRFGSQAVSFKE